MKISITPNPEEGSAATPRPRVLGDDAARDFIELVPPIEGLVEVQVVSLPRAATKERFLRQNAEVRLTFIVHKGHASFAAARAYAISEIKEVKGIVGTLTLSDAGASGGGSETISDCIISTVRVLKLNAETVILYAVEGGDFD